MIVGRCLVRERTKSRSQVNIEPTNSTGCSCRYPDAKLCKRIVSGMPLRFPVPCIRPAPVFYTEHHFLCRYRMTFLELDRVQLLRRYRKTGSGTISQSLLRLHISRPFYFWLVFRQDRFTVFGYVHAKERVSLSGSSIWRPKRTDVQQPTDKQVLLSWNLVSTVLQKRRRA